MKENEKNELEKRNDLPAQNEALEVPSDENVLNANELFAVEGGEDEDLDEDCYTQQCVIGANICMGSSNTCVISN